MRKLFPIFICLFVIGCMKDKFPPQQFMLTGAVRVHNEVKEKSKVVFEVCKGIEWLNPDKTWNTTTDKWGNYKIVVSSDWFGCYYRVKVSAVDKHNNFFASELEYGIVNFGESKKDFWLGEKKKEEEKKKRRRSRRY
ncbi:hypothetical protein KAW50_06485 [candidate division WOR-3 bacterium]|nr:hypothetical protein [candidate division WOR-3 bacterium]